MTDDVQNTNVPHIKSLTIIEILDFGRRKAAVDEYLPQYKTNKYPNRPFL